MAIKFHRPYEDYAEGDIVELDPTMEDYLVRKNFADFTVLVKPEPKPVKPKKVKE